MTDHRSLWEPDHEECPERYTSVRDRMLELGLLQRCVRITGRPAAEQELLRVHDADYISMIKSTRGVQDEEELEMMSSAFDAVFFHPETYELALLAAGSGIELVSSVVRGGVRNGFALIRPPGHHAMRADACGFCFFNNVAIAAMHALDVLSLERILIIDWDVHHGQATQYTFDSDPRVMYVSIHRYEDGKFWPELIESDYHHVGAGPGKGFNVNIPLNQTKMNDKDYLSLFHNIILPLAYRFDPQLVLVSAGYDAAIGCPEGEMRVSPAAFSHFTHSLMSLAEGKIVVFMEGGYCLQSLAESAALTLRSLLSDPAPAILHLSSQKVHQSLLESALNVIYALRPHHQDLFPLQGQFDRRHDDSDNCDFYRIRHYPVVNYRGTASLKPKPEQYPTRGISAKQDPDVKQKLLEEIQYLKDKTKLNNDFIGKKRTGIAYNELMKDHKCAVAHPERPSRVLAIFRRLSDDQLVDKCLLFPQVRHATDEEILLAHSQEYLQSVKRIKTLSEKEVSNFAHKQDSMYLVKSSEEVARVAVGSLLNLVDAVMQNEILNGFAVIRPPGHHSQRDRMAGFCIFNNIAIAAEYLITKYKQERILIVDFDVHHGDGTQSIVQGNSKIQFISLHRYDLADFYPSKLESGIRCDDSNILNIPWNSYNMGSPEYLAALFNIILPVAYDFDPQIILISAGFDAAVKDPLGEYNVDPQFFGHLIHHLMPLAGGRIIAALEVRLNIL